LGLAWLFLLPTRRTASEGHLVWGSRNQSKNSVLFFPSHTLQKGQAAKTHWDRENSGVISGSSKKYHGRSNIRDRKSALAGLSLETTTPVPATSLMCTTNIQGTAHVLDVNDVFS